MIENDKLGVFLSHYSSLGWKIFPIKQHGKNPLLGDNLSLASSDETTLKGWFFGRYKNANMGMACAQSGFVVVDIDTRNGGMEAWDKIVSDNGGNEPETLKQVTPSGGIHYIFKARPGKRYRGKVVSGIDVKYNGYIVVSPSTIGGVAYRFANELPVSDYPEWIERLIEKTEFNRSQVLNSSFSFEYISKLVEELRTVRLDYHEWLTAGMAIHQAYPDDKGLDLYIHLSKGVNYVDGDEEKCIAKWESFDAEEENGITAASLSHLAKSKGITLPNCMTELDKEAFKRFKAEAFNNQREDAALLGGGFQEETDGRLVCWEKTRVVEEINKMGYHFLATGQESPVVFTELNEDGTLGIRSMRIKNFIEKTAPYVFRYTKATSTDIKVIDEPAGRVWIDHAKRKEIDRIVFKEKEGKRELNLFRPLEVADVVGSPDLLLDLVFKALCASDNRKFEWYLNFLAHTLQRPFDPKVTVVPVHISKQGTGKGIMYDMAMRKILKQYFITVQSSNELTQQFNIHLSQKLLTFIDEATWRGNKTEDGVLKKLIGSPTMSVEEKFGARYEIENFSRYAIASNNADAVSMETGNRRYVILEADDNYAGRTDFFHPIAEAIRHNFEAEKFYHYLMSRDISSFNPYKILERNTDGQSSKFSSNGAVGLFWQDVLFEDRTKLWSPKGLNCNFTYDMFIAFQDKTKTWDKGISRKLFWNKTENLVGKLGESIYARNGEERVYVKPISPKEFFERLCKTVEVALPKDFEAKDFINNSEDEYDF